MTVVGLRRPALPAWLAVLTGVGLWTVAWSLTLPLAGCMAQRCPPRTLEPRR